MRTYFSTIDGRMRLRVGRAGAGTSTSSECSIMRKLKAPVLAALIAGSVFTTSSVFASGYEVWDGTAWVRNSVDTFSGPFNLKYLGMVYPCTATFTWTLANGRAQTTGTFTGSPACTNITMQPAWVSPPVPIPGSTSVKMAMSNVVIQISGPSIMTCTGNMMAELSRANPYLPDPPNHSPPYNYIMVDSTLGPCTTITPAPGMPSSGPVRAYFP